MRPQTFEATIELLRGGGADPLSHILDMAKVVAECPAAAVIAGNQNEQKVLASRGLPLSIAGMTFHSSEALNEMFASPFCINNASNNPVFKHHPLVRSFEHWDFIASVPVLIEVEGWSCNLVCLGNGPHVKQCERILSANASLARVIADEISLIGEIAAMPAHDSHIRLLLSELIDAVNHAATITCLIDSELKVAAISRPFSSALSFDRDSLVGASVSDIIKKDGGDPKIIDYLNGRFECLDSDPGFLSGRYDYSPLIYHSMRFVDELSGSVYLLVNINPAEDTKTPPSPADYVARDHEGVGVTTKFLLDTVIEQPRMITRRATTYYAVNRWRKTIKDHQIKALRLLKAEMPDGFVACVADQLVATAIALGGKTSIQAVGQVPCGNSGPNCLACRLASEVADRLGVEYVELFEPIDTRGSSHPRRNVNRPNMKLVGSTEKTVLLIDDVATSGAHIEEAVRLLRNQNISVFPLVWIAP